MTNALKLLFKDPKNNRHDLVQGAAVYALDLPSLHNNVRSPDIMNDGFMHPFAAAITCVRYNRCSQLFCATNDDETAEKQVQKFLRGLLDTLQLPGEKIEFEIKLGEKIGLIVITLFKQDD